MQSSSAKIAFRAEFATSEVIGIDFFELPFEMGTYSAMQIVFLIKDGTMRMRWFD